MKKRCTWQLLTHHRGQASLEYLMLLGLFFIVLSSVTYLSSQQINEYVIDNEVEDGVKTIARTVDMVGALGPGTEKVIQYKAPRNAKERYTAQKEIVFINSDDGESSIHYPTKPYVFGLLETGPGLKYMVLKTQDNGYVSISPLSFPDLYDGLIAYYNFEVSENGNYKSMVDDLSQARSQGGVVCGGEQGYIGGGCNFSSSESSQLYVDAQNMTYNTSFTISFWVYPNEFVPSDTWAVMVRHSTTFNNGFFFRYNNVDPNIRFQVHNNVGAGVTSSNIPANEWMHFVGAYDGSRVYLYENGALRGSSPTSFSSILYLNNNLYIGGRGTGDFFNGRIDEVMIWNRSLSLEEIERLHDLGRDFQ